MKKFGLMLVALLLPFMVQAEEFKEGVHYAKVPVPSVIQDKSKVEVIEMFGYPCPHCNNFEPLIKHWEKNQNENVKFVRTPVAWNPRWELMARAFYASEFMKTLDKTHEATFHAIHVERRRFTSKENFAEYYGNLGVDTAKFQSLFNSFAVETKIRQGRKQLENYGIKGVPAMVVNGKYHVTAGMAGGHKKMLEVVDFLVEKEGSAAK